MEFEEFTYTPVNSNRSNSEFEGTDTESQNLDFSQCIELSQNNSFNHNNSQNSSSHYENYVQQQQQYQYQIWQQQQQQFYYYQQQQNNQFFQNQGMPQFNIPSQQYQQMHPMYQQQYFNQVQYPHMQQQQSQNNLGYKHPQYQYRPEQRASLPNLPISNIYSQKQQTPIESGKNHRMEAMRKKLTCVDTGKGGQILKQFGKRNSCGSNNIPTFNKNLYYNY